MNKEKIRIHNPVTKSYYKVRRSVKSNPKDTILNTIWGELNYELTENFDAQGWNNDGWKDEIYKLLAKTNEKP